MGLLDFLKKGVEKPASQPKPTAAPVTPKAAPAAVTPAAPNTPAPATKPAEQTYTVQKGDTLSKIAKEVYGNANDWNKIFQANKNLITNPDLIKPGQILTIPKK